MAYLKKAAQFANTNTSDLAGGLTSMQIIQAGTTTYTTPAGISTILVFCTGSGGGGGAAPTTPASDSAGGGGAGGTSIRIYSVAGLATYPCAVATGGAGGLEGNNNGAAGATSTFEGPSFTITATGGGFGKYGNNHASPGAGGLGVNGQFNLRGSAGGGGQDAALGSVGAGMGGSSYWGGGGAGASHTTAATVGETGGGGGGAIHSGDDYRDGKAGGNGIIVVYEYK